MIRKSCLCGLIVNIFELMKPYKKVIVLKNEMLEVMVNYSVNIFKQNTYKYIDCQVLRNIFLLKWVNNCKLCDNVFKAHI